MERIWRELSHSARSLLKQPGFTLPAVFVLALGFGANTTVFSVLHGVLLKPLPFSDPERLVLVWTRNGEHGLEEQVSAPDLEDLRTRTKVFSEVTAFGPWGLTMTASEDPERIPTLAVTANFFQGLGIQALYGRTFSPEEGTPGRDRVVVLSHSLWQSRFSGDPRVVGRQIELDQEPYTVVGVLSPEISFPTNLVGFWKPLAIDFDPEERASRWLHVIGRLAPGVSAQQADQELAALSLALAGEHPETNRGWVLEVAPLHNLVVGKPRAGLVFLQLVVGFVLLIACVNVANLLLARAESRRYEFAVRNALGAGWRSLLAQLLTESFLLCLAGGAAGLLLAWGGLRWLLALLPRNVDIGDFSEVTGHSFPRFEQVGIDATVLAVTFLVLIATTMVFGLVPFFCAWRRDLRSPLASIGFPQQRVRRFLVVTQVTLALALLIAAGLLLRSLVATLKVTPGFDARGVLTLQFSVGQVRDPIHRSQVLQEMLAAVEALPDVEFVSLDTAMPFTNVESETEFRPLETEAAVDSAVLQTARLHTIDAGYFRTLRIPLRRGRVFDKRDVSGRPLVVIVNETLSRRYWPGQNPIGRQIVLAEAEEHPFEVVGVVADTHQEGLDVAVVPEIYTVFTQQPPRTVTLAARTAGDPMLLVPAVKARLREVMPGLAIRNVFPLTTLVGDSTTSRRFTAVLTGVLAAIALLLAVAGIYGIIAYSAAERRHELAVRIALGARREEILLKVIGEGFKLGLTGVGLGLIAALFLNRLLRSMLFGISATDPLTFLVVPLLLIAVTCLATVPVARQAMRLDPAETLRYE